MGTMQKPIHAGKGRNAVENNGEAGRKMAAMKFSVTHNKWFSLTRTSQCLLNASSLNDANM